MHANMVVDLVLQQSAYSAILCKLMVVLAGNNKCYQSFQVLICFISVLVLDNSCI